MTQHTFYDIRNFSKEQLKELFVDAKKLAFNWWVDELPGWRREKVDMSFEDVMKIFDDTPRNQLHNVFIHRSREWVEGKDYLEIGFTTLIRHDEHGNLHPRGDVFLWIRVDLKYKDYLLQKHNITGTL